MSVPLYRLGPTTNEMTKNVGAAAYKFRCRSPLAHLIQPCSDMGRRLLSAAAVDRLLRYQSAVASCVADLPDLAEEDVWAAAHGALGGGKWKRANNLDRQRHVGGLSRALEGGHGAGSGLVISEPVAVSAPSWATMSCGRVWPAGEEDGEQQAEKQWVPPHEYLAREHVPALATSVFEGVGRTLKGRDMSRVRDAVWRQTGFFG